MKAMYLIAGTALLLALGTSFTQCETNEDQTECCTPTCCEDEEACCLFSCDGK